MACETNHLDSFHQWLPCDLVLTNANHVGWGLRSCLQQCVNCFDTLKCWLNQAELAYMRTLQTLNILKLYQMRMVFHHAECVQG
jgi:hypothetical protein